MPELETNVTSVTEPKISKCKKEQRSRLPLAAGKRLGGASDELFVKHCARAADVARCSFGLLCSTVSVAGFQPSRIRRALVNTLNRRSGYRGAAKLSTLFEFLNSYSTSSYQRRS